MENFRATTDAAERLRDRYENKGESKRGNFSSWEEFATEMEKILESGKKGGSGLDRVIKDLFDRYSSLKERSRIKKLDRKLDDIISRLDELEEGLRNLEKANEVKSVMIREISEEQAKEEILDYLDDKESAYPSDIADDLNIPVGFTLDIVYDLIEEDKLGEMEGN